MWPLTRSAYRSGTQPAYLDPHMFSCSDSEGMAFRLRLVSRQVFCCRHVPFSLRTHMHSFTTGAVHAIGGSFVTISRDRGVFRSSRRCFPCPRLCLHPYASIATCPGVTLVGTCSPPLLSSGPPSSLLVHRCGTTDSVSLSHDISERVTIVRGSVGRD